MREAFVARPGFEPRHTEPKSVVLPLYYQAIAPFLSEWAAKIRFESNYAKFFKIGAKSLVLLIPGITQFLNL